MELTLLGTGAPDGLPRPDCPCAACASALGDHVRAATALLVDGVLLLDLTPGAAFAAARAGRSLSGVRQVLLSHPQEGPALEHPAGLPAAGRVPEGRELALLDGHRVRALAMDAPGTGYEVIGPGGERLLYLPPGCAPAGLNHPAPYDMVVADVVGRPDALARLRAAGAVTATTDVLAVHLDHDVPPGAELRRRLAAAGARAVPDGTTVVVGEFHAVPDLPRRTLVLGGARSGKSVEAERRLESFPEVVYVATGGSREGDAEWAARVGLHRERRPGSWRTEETCELVPLLDADGPPLLVDCLSLWLTDAMDRVGAWDDDKWAAGGERALRERVAQLTEAVRATRRTVVAVSNEVGSGVVPATAAGRRFRDELGRLNAAFAAECECVLLVVAGQAVTLRG
ncbi:bifunctional adenosylcobinamide kinase/adenosylcobinamide-phosphate guanylyltransferase [Streptomyces sp. LHD-70]|uniref:bifunctional adenosylcobinamide kinase/adenosylcobinamide-phosphate guanylyltransferase n=1 Tax=Streptomyces sp. LHD-70 TaxID=3072140 RepID=UPI0028100E3E|nr:bifunctional adenosylcobinamide kinase/adenosylcobinamide-phosphate guanylyltransferase [Streptomyces sp. LHD-70]MDQ8701415.1 bifunctional adenosylcobinamide kinase/adenosylcobinamide-phosphate guanylyltransferase [Streptomyces sp. LHD-70]